MCVKLTLRDLNPGPYFSHPTIFYICGVITKPNVRGG